MNILALETATEWCSAALWRDGVVTQEEAHAGNRHSHLLLPMVQRVLAAQGLTISDLDGIAYGQGPGSFTGLRIACGVTQGLALVAGCPVLGVGTLAALAAEAWQAGAVRQVYALIDARMGEIYAQAFVDGAPQTVPTLYRPEDLPVPGVGHWSIVGTGFAAYADAIGAHWAATGFSDFVLSEVRYPRAAQIAELAAPRLVVGEGVSAGFAEPLYVRNKVALTIRERAGAAA